ncbi:helix-turn-helix domain containing protein [Mameliella alba]|nr:helix-turn-helix domain containing protein [Mameliella alba]
MRDARLDIPADHLPNWVPDAARVYLAHTEQGCSIRELARQAGCHASTVLRQVRRIETRRDDPLVDAALCNLGAAGETDPAQETRKDTDPMNAAMTPTPPDEATLAREARRVLRRLCESGAVLAVAVEMDKAVVVRDTGDGGSTRTAVVDVAVAQAMALKDWIGCDAPGRISRYRITSAGRAALNRLVAEQESRVRGFAEAQAGFETGRDAEAALDEVERDPRARKGRYMLAESPLTALGRRRSKDGEPFLSDELIAAGERLREDFELAQMGPRTAQNWDQFLTAGVVTAPAGRRTAAPQPRRPACRRHCATWAPALGTWRCAAAAISKDWRPRKKGWAGRPGRARSCCASRCSVCAATTRSAARGAVT